MIGAAENYPKKRMRGRPKKENGRSTSEDKAAVRACLDSLTKSAAAAEEVNRSTTEVLIDFFKSKPLSQVSIYRSNANELNSFKYRLLLLKKGLMPTRELFTSYSKQ